MSKKTPGTITHNLAVSELTVAIISLDVQDKIHAQLESLKMFKNIVLVDNGSRDNTAKTAKKMGATVVTCLSKDFKELRYAAMEAAPTDWIFFIDTDEYIPEKMFERMIEVFRKEKNNYAGFWLPRRNYWGRGENDYLHHGILYPDYQLRLIPTTTRYKNTPHDEPDIDHDKTYYFSDVEIFHYQKFEKLFSLTGIKNYKSFTVNYAKTQVGKSYLHLMWDLLTAPIKYFLMPLTRGKGILDGYYGIVAAFNFTIQMVLIAGYAMLLKYRDCPPFAKATEWQARPCARNDETIAVDGGDFDPSGKVHSGIQRIVYEFYKNTNGENIKFLNFKYQDNNVIKLPRKFFFQLFIPLWILLNRAKHYIGFSGTIPYLLKYLPINKIVLIYDFGFYSHPQFYDNSQRLKRNQEFAILHADLIVVLSQYSKNEIIKYYPQTNKSKMKVILPGVNLRPSNFVPKYKNYYLFVGAVRPIKNIEKVLEVFDNMPQKDKRLLFVGKVNEEYLGLLKKRSGVVLLGNISDHELYGYYKYSLGLLNFSHVEGFGLPILECLSTGGRIITNNIPVFEEHKNSFGKNRKLYTWSNFTHELLNSIIKS